MPELPEVETIIQTLTPFVEGRKVVGYSIYNPKTVQGDRALEESIGCKLGKPFRRGKLIVLPLLYKKKIQYNLCVHLKMTGKLFVFSELVEPNVYTRVTVSFDTGSMLFFDDIRKFGYIRLIPSKELDSWSFWKTLGPEPFEIDSLSFAETLKSHKGMIKSLLLNQKVIAGCGNIYADESLFRAKIPPFVQVSQLSIKTLQQLHRVLLEVFLESIAACGSSIKDYRTAQGDVGSFQNSFYVYGRSGQFCFICKSILKSTKLGGRMTVWCPQCQLAKQV